MFGVPRCKCVHVRRLMISVNANRAQGPVSAFRIPLPEGRDLQMEYAVSAGQTKERSLAGSTKIA